MCDLADGSEAWIARARKRLVQTHAGEASLCGQLCNISRSGDITEGCEEESRIVFFCAGCQVCGNVFPSLKVVSSVIPSEGFFALCHAHVSQQAAISVASRMSLL